MAYSIFGYIKKLDSSGNCAPAANITVWAYFNKVDSNSSPSQWTSTPYTTDSNGYYTITIEDDNFVGINASYKRGLDEIWIAAIDGDTVLDSTSLTHASFIVHQLTQDDYNELNFDLIKTRSPSIDSYTKLPSILNTNTTYTLSSTASIITNWEQGHCYLTDVSQKYKYATVPIFTAHSLDRTVYDIQDTSYTVNPNTSKDFSYITAGDRQVTITVYEKWGTFTTITQNVSVKYNEPSVDFTWDPKTINDSWDTNTKIRGNETITFSNLTKDLDDRSSGYTYEFIITDAKLDGTTVTKTFSNLSLSDTVAYNFLSPGSKTIELKCYWNDGYEDKVSSVSKSLTIYEKEVLIDSINQLNFAQDRWTKVDFSLSVTGNLSDISNVLWLISDYYDADNPDNPNPGNTEDNSAVINGAKYSDIVSHKFQALEAHKIQVEITYNTGWEDKTVNSETFVSLGQHVLNPDFKTDNSQSVYGKVPVTYSDNTKDTLDLFKTGQYFIDDVDLDGAITKENSKVLGKSDTFVYTFKFPSRAPFSAVNGAKTNNYNKKVKYEITYDNGWVITSTFTKKYFEAAPIEVSGTIDMRCNVDGVSW